MLQTEQILHHRYQIKQKLGQNAGRQTWLAHDLSTQSEEPVVIKFLIFGGDVYWQDIKLFERESQVLKHLDHPCIPKYRDYFTIDDRNLCFGLVQEYIPGTSLKDLLNQGRKFTELEIRFLANKVLQILNYLHQLNPLILHRDIKSSNLIWNKDDQIYLVDFGAVQYQSLALGGSFTVVGTYGYTPFEQFGGRTVPASDLYALGATIIHLLTGISPAELPIIKMQIQFADNINISPSLSSWIQKMTEPSLDERFATAGEAMSALNSNSILTKLSQQQNSILEQDLENSFLDNFKVPCEIKGWNWGAFLLTPIWCLSNNVFIGLLCWLPWVIIALQLFMHMSRLYQELKLGLMLVYMVQGLQPAVSIIYLFTAFLMGIYGNELAWRSNSWTSIKQFKTSQQRWAIIGIFIGIPFDLFSCYIWSRMTDYFMVFVKTH